jgi:predicted nucleotidyltransferase
MLLQDLVNKKLLTPPVWLPQNTMFLATMGSVAYGVAEDTSDFDVYGFCIPPKKDIFPYAEKLYGFDTASVFEQYQQHHIFDQDALGGKGREYDFTIFSIIKYFKLCMEGNPNLLDSLFVPQSCILHSTRVSELIRDNRKLFLTKLIWPRFKGYAYGQLHKASGKNPEEGSKRHKLREQHGYDSKYLYHVIRLLSECEQILTTGDLDLQEKGRREHMKAIRRGETPEVDIRKWAAEKELQLEKAFSESTLPQKPDEAKIKALLIQCLEEHYGSLSNFIAQIGWAEQTLKDLDETINKVRKQLYT